MIRIGGVHRENTALAQGEPARRHGAGNSVAARALPAYIEEAKKIIAATPEEFRTLTIDELPRTDDFEELRWFPLPSEVLSELRGVPTGRHAALLRP